MKDTPLSNNERSFVQGAMKSGLRVDGRGVYDFRRIRIAYQPERGHVEVQLGRTRVMVQVSCELTKPFPDRPAEGAVQFNVELSPMASPAFEPGRPSEQAIELSRMVERVVKDSNAIDTTSLCVISGEAVWNIRVDLHALDHDGNLSDALCMAALAGLIHFRKPEVSMPSLSSGDESVAGNLIIHDVREREPLPLSVHHMPLCVTFAFLDDGEHMVVDPTFQEERVAEGYLIVAMNIHREVCAVHKHGSVLLDASQISRCTKIAAIKVAEMTELLQKSIDEEEQLRANRRAGKAPAAAKSNKSTIFEYQGSIVQ
ncbi:polymyositis/scleroderma autoantigen 1 [Capsaspora owczarzaki ATCC 30864]|uniref:Exosome complex component RRP45 n=1 Tax=Capsaspora owczarzaki (strain ATCC 30864) TaxID=595528 RepID=A0A0D2X0F9_CAPO3|nr:polymyositis/scleroderma autoantigen 1 [Capsaspora owczarzaki ATCC 30864]KJE88989.1 polymyositis/scleroderma autoantigen 1 [Capsaspora owczarzaki ATCC 30864]|eukprot:XP_004365424.1 polymyositis/scleroderma autoantigen 1 [Capsaspora owczarzaki ATCC 30864]